MASSCLKRGGKKGFKSTGKLVLNSFLLLGITHTVQTTAYSTNFRTHSPGYASFPPCFMKLHARLLQVNVYERTPVQILFSLSGYTPRIRQRARRRSWKSGEKLMRIFWECNYYYYFFFFPEGCGVHKYLSSVALIKTSSVACDGGQY